MTLAVYGLLPRAIFFAVAPGRLQRALRRAFLEAPGNARALDRLDSPLLDNRRQPRGERSRRRGRPTTRGGRRPPARAGSRGELGEACVATGAGELACTPVASFDAGGPRSPAQDT